MLGRTAACLLLGTGLFLAIVWSLGLFPVIAQDGSQRVGVAGSSEPTTIVRTASAGPTIGFGSPSEPAPPAKLDAPKPAPRQDIGARLYAQNSAPSPAPAPTRIGVVRDPIVISNARVDFIDTEEVPSQRDGVLSYIGTPILAEDRGKYPPDRVREIIVGGKPSVPPKFYLTLKVGDYVEANQQIAQVDNSLAEDELRTKEAKRIAAGADKDSSIKTRDEAAERFKTQTKLYGQGGNPVASMEDVRGAKLTWERYIYEVTSKDSAIKVADAELGQAKTTVAMYEIRSKIPGYVKAIKRKDGESVKSLDPVVQIINTSRLKLEGRLDPQYAYSLKKGMEVVVEPTYRDPPKKTFTGHTGAITSVAVSKDPIKPYIVSGSTDSTAIVWDPSQPSALRTYVHPAHVRVVACTPPGSETNLCLTGDAQGKARLFDLDQDTDKPLRELNGHHRTAITAAAFSPDGKTCATGSDDGEVMLWDVATGALKYSISELHSQVGGLTFTPQSELVTATGADIRVWQLGQTGAQEKNHKTRQSNQVAQVGVSPDGKYYLDGLGNEMREISFATGATEAVLRNPVQASMFQTLSLFSPDGRLVLTASGTDGNLQIWKLGAERSFELRQLTKGEGAGGKSTACAAIAPNMQFMTAGGKDGKVYVWSMPSEAEINQQLKGVIVSIDHTIEGLENRTTITAEAPNPSSRYLFGNDVATFVVYPEK